MVLKQVEREEGHQALCLTLVCYAIRSPSIIITLIPIRRRPSPRYGWRRRHKQTFSNRAPLPPRQQLAGPSCLG